MRTFYQYFEAVDHFKMKVQDVFLYFLRGLSNRHYGVNDIRRGMDYFDQVYRHFFIQLPRFWWEQTLDGYNKTDGESAINQLINEKILGETNNGSYLYFTKPAAAIINRIYLEDLYL